MKKLILLALTLLVGCSIAPRTGVFYPGVPTSGDPQEMDDWISWNIRYKTDKELYGYDDYWATREETYKNKAGDCEDKAEFFGRSLYENTGKKCHYELYWVYEAESYHVVAVFNGHRFGYMEDSRYIKDWTFDYVESRVGTYSNKSLSVENEDDAIICD